MGVIESQDENNVTHYSIYTEDKYFHVLESSIVEESPHILGMIPIFEYPANNARLGAFEIVLPLLDAINNVESNRLDGVEQIVQAFIKFINCDITKDEYEAFLEMGAIKVKSVDGSTGRRTRGASESATRVRRSNTLFPRQSRKRASVL